MNWDNFFKAHEKKAYAISVSYLRDKDEAFDVVQDAMISMYKSYKEIDDEEDARKLFYRILNNKLTDKYRSLKRFFSLFSMSEEVYEDIKEDPDQDHFAIENALKKLTSIQKRVLLLKTIEDFTFKEISELTGASESSCKTHYSRALKKIKEDDVSTK